MEGVEMKFGKKIIKLRIHANLIQKELAARLEMKAERLSEFENDKYAPSPELLFRIAKACDMYVGYFYSDIDPQFYGEMTKNLKYSYYISSLPYEVARYLRKMIKASYDLNLKDKNQQLIIDSINLPDKKRKKKKSANVDEIINSFQ